MKIERGWADRLRAAVPFGWGESKPHHFVDMAKVAWANRDNLGYGWKVLSLGVCDGCALGVSGFRDWTLSSHHLCLTRLNLLRLNTMGALDPARLTDVGALRELPNHALRELGRLPYPFSRRRGERGFTRISWDEAIRRIADRLRAADARRIAFYLTSRGLTNEVYYVAQKLARSLGTNNIENAARLCHSPSTGAMKQALGVAATTCSYRDWYGTDVVVFFGSNAANDQPVTMKYLHEAKRLGTKVVLVNPMREPGMDRYWVPSIPSSALFGTNILDWWFPVAQGGDIALLYGVIRVLIECGGCDRGFVERHTERYEELRDAALAQQWPDLERASGLKKAEIEQLAGVLAGARSGVLVWSMGITQHAFGGDAVRMIVNLGLLKGWVGRDKCGLMPIRGHSGVQGGAEMGAYSTALPGGVAITQASAAALSARYGFEVPSAPGLSAPEMLEAAARGALDVLYCAGGNFLRTLPDPAFVAGALRNIPLRVHQDIILNDQMLLDAAEEVILLPAQTRYEQAGGGTETTTERRVLFSPEIPRQVAEARAEWRIFRELAIAAHPEYAATFGCGSGSAIRAEIAAVVPFYAGIEKLAVTGDQFQYGGPHLCAGGHFPTPSGRARFVSVPMPDRTPPAGRFHLSTRRGKQFNTLIYAEIDPLTGAGRDAIFMNPDDAAALHLMHGDAAAVSSDSGRLDGRVHLCAIARGNVQMHWPEANPLLPRHSIDTTGGVPDYNAWVVVSPPP